MVVFDPCPWMSELETEAWKSRWRPKDGGAEQATNHGDHEEVDESGIEVVHAAAASLLSV